MSDHPAADRGLDPSRDPRGSDRPVAPPKPARRSPSEHRPSPARGGDAERRPVGGRTPARWEPEGLSPGFHPRSVTPGIETQTAPPDPETPPEKPTPLPPPGVHVRLDWMRLVGSENAFCALNEILQRAFGDPTSESTGARWFRSGTNWHPGVTLSHGHKAGILQLDVRGERLTVMGTDAAIALMEQIYNLKGFWATRLDAAIDFVGQDVDLHRHAAESCRRGELCRIRRYADDSEYTSNNEPTRLLLKLGKRESPICGRIYDKGLETKSAPPGVWERLEIEYKVDRARTLALRLLECPDEWPRILQEAVLGSIDFRVNNGRSELDRRPRTDWWSAIVADTHCHPIPPTPGDSGFESWWEWGRTSFAARFLQMAQILQVNPADLFRLFILDLCPSDTESPATVDLRSNLGTGRYPKSIRKIPAFRSLSTAKNAVSP